MRTSRVFPTMIVAGSMLLAACGVDTTGLSASSSREPMGSASALVTLTEYGDLQCPACKTAHEILTKPLLATYEGNIRFAFKHFPLQSIHVYALEASEAAECAADQGKFWEFVDTTYANQKDLNSTALRTWAADLGLDQALFDRCVRSGIKKKTVLADLAEGEAKGVNSTPTYFVNGVRVQSNTLDAMSSAIDAVFRNSSSVPL